MGPGTPEARRPGGQVRSVGPEQGGPLAEDALRRPGAATRQGRGVPGRDAAPGPGTPPELRDRAGGPGRLLIVILRAGDPILPAGDLIGGADLVRRAAEALLH